MPLRQIQTTEYECNRCGYKWIERRNGMDQGMGTYLDPVVSASLIYGIQNAQKAQLLQQESGMIDLDIYYYTPSV